MPQNQNKKQSAAANSEMAELKKTWRAMPDVERAYWQELFASKTRIANIIKEIAAKLGVDLKEEYLWCRFRNWELDQRARDKEAEHAEDDQRQLAVEHSHNLTLEEMREKLLIRSYQRTINSGNFKLGLAVIREDMHVKKVALDERKLELLEKKAEQADATETTLAEPHLTPEERAQRIREIYGRA